MKKPSDIIKDTRDKVTKPVSSINWLKLLLTMAGLIALSFLLAYLVNLAQDKWNIDVPKYSHLAYIIVFVTSLIANATIIAPVPFAVAIMISSAQNFNPLIISACAAFGGTLGELSGYYAGRLGRKIAIPDSIIGYKKLEGWINKYGPLAIAVIAFQPVIPFDMGGLIAGAAKMPLYKFLPALFLGKFCKYILLTWAGIKAFNFLPWLSGNG